MLSKGVLPSEVDEQDPIDLLEALFTLTEGYEEEEDEEPQIDYANTPPMFW